MESMKDSMGIGERIDVCMLSMLCVYVCMLCKCYVMHVCMYVCMLCMLCMYGCYVCYV